MISEMVASLWLGSKVYIIHAAADATAILSSLASFIKIQFTQLVLSKRQLYECLDIAI